MAKDHAVSMYFVKNILSRLGITLLLLLSVAVAFSQPMDNSRHVDTLTLKQRISLRTNITDWALMVPNIGAEFDIRKENWNRWSAGINLRWRPRTPGTFVRPWVFNIFEVTLEGRQYWRERRAEASGYYKRHTKWYDKLFSCRVMAPSHPRWIFYRGGYVTYSDYSIYASGLINTGRQGQAVMAGFTWGFVKPLYAYRNGSSIDVEFGFSAGLAYTKFSEFNHDRVNDTYPELSKQNWHLEKYPMVRDIHAALVYRMGNYPIQKKYRWRYDVDLQFRTLKDSLWAERQVYLENKFVRDSIYKVVSREFRILYDSCVDQRHIQEQKDIDRKAPVRLANDNDAQGRQEQTYVEKMEALRDKKLKADSLRTARVEERFTRSEERERKRSAKALQKLEGKR